MNADVTSTPSPPVNNASAGPDDGAGVFEPWQFAETFVVQIPAYDVPTITMEMNCVFIDSEAPFIVDRADATLEWSAVSESIEVELVAKKMDDERRDMAIRERGSSPLHLSMAARTPIESGPGLGNDIMFHVQPIVPGAPSYEVGAAPPSEADLTIRMEIRGSPDVKGFPGTCE